MKGQKDLNHKLIDAVANYDLEGVREALDQGADISATMSAGGTSAGQRQKGMIEIALEDSGASIRTYPFLCNLLATAAAAQNNKGEDWKNFLQPRLSRSGGTTLWRR